MRRDLTRRHVPTTATDVLSPLLTGEDDDVLARSAPLSTGFDVLDASLGGGLTATELLLLGGLPGVGKTVAALQMARNLARDGHPVVYACYEHTVGDLLVRLLLMELGEEVDALDPHLELLRDAVSSSVVDSARCGR